MHIPPFEPLVSLGSGPTEYFFQCPNKWTHGTVPEALVNHLRSGTVIYLTFISFAPNGGLAMGYKGDDGKHHIYSSGIPQAAHTWLHEKSSGKLVRDASLLYCYFGGGGAYFLLERGGIKWGNLPPRLNSALQSRLHVEGGKQRMPTLTLISLGISGNYFCTFEGSPVVYDLPAYPALRSLLSEVEKYDPTLVAISGLWLHLSKPDCFVIAYEKSRKFTFHGFDHGSFANILGWENVYHEDLKRSVKLPDTYPGWVAAEAHRKAVQQHNNARNIKIAKNVMSLGVLAAKLVANND